MEKAGADEILVKFVSAVLNSVLLLIVVIASLNQLGVNTTSLIAVLGAAGLAVGLALKDSLQNFAAGVMIIIFRPFKIGDFVETAGVDGFVDKISIFSTTLKTMDNREVIIPNGLIYSSAITNFTSQAVRRVDMVFGIAYDDDIRKARAIMAGVIASDDRVVEEPKTVIAVGELADSSVNFFVRPWVKTEDYWDALFDLTEEIKLALDENGITIPFPQMDLHVDNSS
jgi:small conductance mechanosensitive channel